MLGARGDDGREWQPGLDDIVIPAGTYELTQPVSETPSSLEGDLDLDEAVVITGAGSRETIIRQTVDDRVILTNAAPAGLVPGALSHGPDDHRRPHNPTGEPAPAAAACEWRTTYSESTT